MLEQRYMDFVFFTLCSRLYVTLNVLKTMLRSVTVQVRYVSFVTLYDMRAMSRCVMLYACYVDAAFCQKENTTIYRCLVVFIYSRITAEY